MGLVGGGSSLSSLSSLSLLSSWSSLPISILSVSEPITRATRPSAMKIGMVSGARATGVGVISPRPTVVSVTTVKYTASRPSMARMYAATIAKKTRKTSVTAIAKRSLRARRATLPASTSKRVATVANSSTSNTPLPSSSNSFRRPLMSSSESGMPRSLNPNLSSSWSSVPLWSVSYFFNTALNSWLCLRRSFMVILLSRSATRV
mmetsp:Transcript_20858/g.59346  ORF Transcript_20858/g.59346 Transcript_20858/m.59346 type:complete len:205 (+) Transcript_20858:432-1046(+)